VQAGATLFAVVVISSLILAPAPEWYWRLLAGFLFCVLAWWPLRALVFQAGPAAVWHFEWTGEGQWWVSDARDRRLMSLAPATSALGPWIMLVWTMRRAGRRYALIDAAYVSPTTFRALRGRLTLSARRDQVNEPAMDPGARTRLPDGRRRWPWQDGPDDNC
jgi:hypothetical protein